MLPTIIFLSGEGENLRYSSGGFASTCGYSFFHFYFDGNCLGDLIVGEEMRVVRNIMSMKNARSMIFVRGCNIHANCLYYHFQKYVLLELKKNISISLDKESLLHFLEVPCIFFFLVLICVLVHFLSRYSCLVFCTSRNNSGLLSFCFDV